MNGLRRRRIPSVAALGMLVFALMLLPVLPAADGGAAALGADADAQAQSLLRVDELSALFRQVARSVKPAVVEVRVIKWVRQLDIEDFLEHFFGSDSPFGFRWEQPRREVRPRRVMAGLGSGVIIDAEAGYILTNFHVVGGADEVEVVLADRRRFQARLVGTDRFTDLAVLKIDADDLSEAPIGDSRQMEVGDWVLAIGSPRGLAQTVTAGIISAKGRLNAANPYQRFIQTDAAINRGNSGGPLVNMRGEVIGINTAISSSSGGNEGIGFAIPSSIFKDITTQLIEQGRVMRGFLGVAVGRVNERLAGRLGLPTTQGALITAVEAGGAADRAGIKAGDFVVSVDGRAVEDPADLVRLVSALRPGSTVPMELYRRGRRLRIDVTIGSRTMPSGESAGPAETDQAAWRLYGLRVVSLTPALARKYGYPRSLEGALISAVAEGSSAEAAQLSTGMVILRVENVSVRSAGDFHAAIARHPQGVRLLVLTPSGMQRFYFLWPGEEAK